MTKSYAKYLILFLICFAVACAYFISIETHAVYGDDLVLYFGHFKNKTSWGGINFYSPIGKFRPIAGIISNFNLFLFDKNLHNYFLFNVGIQTLIICAFTMIVDTVLQSFVLSAVVGFLVGLSRFAFYNVTQLFNGGPSEGLSMLFFLIFLSVILKYLIETETTAKQYKYLLYALLYANLAMYTHERYVVLLVFILLVTLLHRSPMKMVLKKKLVVATISVFSILLHFAFITGVAGLNYLPGADNDLSGFSIASAANSFGDGFLSIIQLNSGNFRRAGVDFMAVATVHQFMLFVIVNLLVISVVLYAVQAYSFFEAGDTGEKRKFRVVLWLLVLFVISLIPVGIMDRLEQRWLQAPFAVFILIVTMVYFNVSVHPVAKRSLFMLFVIHFFISDYNYLLRIEGSFYMKRSEWISSVFRDAAKDELLRSNTVNIFVLESNRNKRDEKELSWVLANGKVFGFYQSKPKKIQYIDSKKFTDPEQLASLLNLNPQTDQVITFDGNIHDITKQVIEERANWINAQNK